jgi:beta-glucosidase/6-phospho-beta-glucosidase/beta-galactosidase
MNGVLLLVLLQYGNGDFAPGIQYGPSGQYKCGHNLLLAHARAYRLYRSKYAATQRGKVGMALWSEWSEPWTQKPEGGQLAAGLGGGVGAGGPAGQAAAQGSCC